VIIEDAGPFLSVGDWRRVFDSHTLVQGDKLMRGRQVSAVRAELLETGDLEIVGQVGGGDDTRAEAIIALWREGPSMQLDASCSCQVAVNCEHAVAVLGYLAKGKPGVRLAGALGQTPHAEAMTQGQHLELREPTPNSAKLNSRFRLRVERQDNRLFARAYALYQKQETPLEPSGNIRPIVTPTEKIKRNRTAEMEALQALYALDLLPNSQLEWTPNKKAWPHPEFYWQRFQHEGTPALESRGWEVQFSPHVGLKPLVFRSENWKAEIIEEGKGWFALSAGFEIDGEAFDLQPILAALVANRFLEVTEGKPKGQEFMIFLPDGRGLVLPVGRFRKILTTLGELVAFKFTAGPMRVTKVDAARLAEENELEPKSPIEVKGLGSKLTDFNRIERVSEPAGLKAELRSYQSDGYYWMQFLSQHELNGILADDMGLGKTLQTLTHLLTEKEAQRNAGLPSLVIAPTSVVVNWQREADKFTPDLRVLILQGADRNQRYAQIPRADLVLTSFALIHRDLEVFLGHRFHLVILDEAQHIKNPTAKVTQAVCQLDSKHRLCLSGTPIENNLSELWSLMHFLMPGLLGTQENFNDTFRNPIEKTGHEGKRAALAARVGPLILRRTKHDVAKELPAKTEIFHTIELNETQKDLYETVRATMDKHVRQALELQGQQSQIVFLDALLKLRQICCHPKLLKSQEDVVKSAKFEHLIDLLMTLRQEGHRTLVFSQFTSMLALIEDHLNAIDCQYLKLTGATKDRQELVERFQAGEGEVFLISLKAGGTGLTLTGADIVIHYDPWWNPAAENQATDRAYRIGQNKPVFVHKLICQDTVEERIQQMQVRKDTLATDLLSGATQQLSLTPETLQSLFAPAK
jgi:superfamily II DNA or RNA helicase